MTANYGSYRPANCVKWVPWEVVLVAIICPLENPGRTSGKIRPAILLSREGARCLVMGLTTRDCYKDGSPRVMVQCPERSGLTGGRSFLWGTPTLISVLDVQSHIGYADESLRKQVNELCGGEYSIGNGLEDPAASR